LNPTAVTFPIAAITLMLWILWSDSIRPHRPTPIVYSIRVMMFLGAAAAIIYNLVSYFRLFSLTSQALNVVAAAIGVGGAVYFFLKATRRIR
jgi:Co/Zn/Cd efflux system component